MTHDQLKRLEALLSEKMPGWRVSRGGIITREPETGIQEVACNKDFVNKFVIVDFDTMTIAILALEG